MSLRCPEEKRPAPRCRIYPVREADPPEWVCLSPGCGAWGKNFGGHEGAFPISCTFDRTKDLLEALAGLVASVDNGTLDEFHEAMRRARTILKKNA